MAKLREMQEKRWFYWLILIALFGLFFVRIGMLEQDLAPWGVAYYQPADEGQYALPVINEYNLGEANPDHAEPYSAFTPYNLRTNFIGNCVIKLGLENIGDNYFGFRISSVIFGFLNLLFLFLNLAWLQRKYAESNSVAKWAIVGILAFFVVDFTFFNASIVVEPSVVRMLFAQLLLFVMLRTQGHGCIRYFLLSFLSMLSIGLVYFSNLFFLLACGLLLLLQWKKEGFRKFFQYGCCFLLGMAAAAALADLYYMQVWGSHFHTNFIQAIASFSGTTGYEITGITNPAAILKSLIKATAFYFSANPFFYCIPLLAAVMIFVPGILVSIFQCKDETAAFLFALPFSFLLQTLFSLDCITRKAAIIYPVVACLVFYMSLIYQEQCRTFLENKCKGWQKSLYLLLSALFIMAVIGFRLFIVSDGTRLDFTGSEKLLILGVGVAPVIGVLLWTAVDLWRGHKSRFAYRKLYCALCLIPLCVSPFMLIKHFVVNRTYTERDMMIQMGETAKDGYVVGAFVSGFTLYNDIKPITAISQEVAIYMKEDPDLLYLDYEDDTAGMRGYFDDFVFKGEDVSSYAVFKGARSFQTYGSQRGFYLYRIKPKSEIVKDWRACYQEYSQTLQDFDGYDSKNFDSLSTEEKINYINERAAQKEAYRQVEETYNPYPDVVGDIYCVPESKNIYVDIYGDIFGDQRFDVYGDIYGDIRGDVYGTIEGNVYGTVYGNVYGEIMGTVSGGITGTKEERR